MSGRMPTWTTCSVHGKRSHPTRKAARRAWKAAHPGESLQVYECQEGYGWHVGNAWGHERKAVPRVPPRELPIVVIDSPTMDPERIEAARLAFSVLVAQPPGRIMDQYEITHAIGLNPESKDDTRVVMAGVRRLRRLGYARPLDWGYVATEEARRSAGDPVPSVL